MTAAPADRLDAILDDLAERIAARVLAVATDDRFGLRPEEAAERLGVGTSTLQGLLRSGAIPSFRVGRLRLVRPDDLRVYAAEQVKAELSRRAAEHPHGAPSALRHLLRRATRRAEEPTTEGDGGAS